MLEGQEQPMRAVIDPSLKIDPHVTENCCHAGGDDMFGTVQVDEGWVRDQVQRFPQHEHTDALDALKATNQVSFISIPMSGNRSLDLRRYGFIEIIPDDFCSDRFPCWFTCRILDELSKRGVEELMLEGGPATVKRFLEQKLVDRAIVIVAPVKFDQMPVCRLYLLQEATWLIHACQVPSLIDHHVLKVGNFPPSLRLDEGRQAAGLVLLAEHREWDNDSVSLWVRLCFLVDPL
eukprot:766072-Hanusia_phi.AAC.2